ncbi:MAG: leucine-rich repeat domain-containing protein, partial [Ureaplasma sp.]|nr:leucine-rich repeat domain-containing protein [Ureaplasma sp.]
IIGNLELLNENDKIFSLKIIPESGYSFLSDSSFYDNGNILLTDIDFYSYIQFTSDNLFVFNSRLQNTIDTSKYSPEKFNEWVVSEQFKNYLSINLSTSNNTNVDITNIESISYDLDSNVVTITPKSMYKFEILGASSNITTNDQGQLLISSLNLYEHINFIKLSDFFNGVQEFIKTNKFTNGEFLNYVGDTNNLVRLKELIADNLYISDSRKININKISNVNISNGNLTITLSTNYSEYTAETYENVSLNNNTLTITNLKFYTVTNLMNLRNVWVYIQSIIDDSSNKFTESELSKYITDNQDTLKTNVASKISISDYEKIPPSQIQSIALDDNNQVIISLDSNYIKYDVRSQANDNVEFSNDNLIVNNLVYYNAIEFMNLTSFYDSIQNKIQSSKYTKMEFSNYVTSNNDDLKELIANNLYISENEKLSLDKISSVSFNSNSNQLSVVLKSNYLKYSFASANDNISISDTTITISNLKYYTLYNFTNIDTLFNAIQNRISSSTNKYTVEEFRNDVTNNNSSLKTLVANNLYISPSTKLDISNIKTITLNSDNDLEISLNSDYTKYSLPTNSNVTLENDVLTISNLVYYTTTNLTKLSELYNYVQNFISNNKYTPSELTTYITNNLSTFKTNLANKLYISSSTTISSSLISSVTLTSSNQLQIVLNSTNKKYTMDSYENATLSGTTITIKNLTFYTSISFSNLDTIRNKIQEIITNNSFTANDFTIYVQDNASTLRSTFINNLTTSVSGPGSWSSSWVNSSVSFNGSSLSISLTLPDNYKYLWTSATSVSFSNNTFTFSDFSWYQPSSSNYFTWNGTTITGLSSAGANQTSIVIPNNCTGFSQYAFRYNTKLTSVTIPGSVKTIKYGAFDSCTNITTLNLEEGIQTIEDYAFTGIKTSYIKIPSTVTNIKLRAFVNAPISTLDIYSNSITLGDGCFSSNSRSSAMYVYFWNVTSTSQVSINNYAFAGGNYANLRFLTSSLATYYQNAINGGSFRGKESIQRNPMHH